ncbi:hypothetical protein [Sinorhizobium meliloti]|uniref:Uncharacterized protein n=1 Tax=Rhizobium meliloti (strain 1021) TaxID=266834 RepID=Q92XB2_RHIME|nr:hypothetical protein [Sinorhizobium meliloti]AGG71048.1 Hypothetical protein SM2011_b20047 [Sinorhizobium meliloti 2011]ASP61634.1 hypothetical protein CDO30_25680 [Sinorhizobium meliloti]MCK3804283.1 hypothetical protein [Sinorhizobium meliloti]MCK3810290.1 hypothetical protein [Sinorhizobium meliloti]MCK3815330.1 hypothetical protein [Sinorhizobium meliloti]
MFYLGGMTLGYLVPPPRTGVAPKPAVSKEPANDRPDRENAPGDGERDQEWARAFLAPWHLFY